MPIDPNIIMGVKPIPFQQSDPNADLQQSLALAHLLQQTQAGKMGIDEKKREIEANDRVRALLGQNPNAPLQDVMAIDPKRGMEIGKFRTDDAARRATIGKDEAAARKSDFERQMLQLSHGATLLNTARDQGSFAQAVQIGVANGVFPKEQAEQWLQQPYSPEFVEQLKAGGLKYAEKLKLDHDAKVAEETRRANVARETETGRHNRRNEGIAAGNLQTSRDRLDFERTGGRAPVGYRFNNTGALEFIPGGPADPATLKDKPLTDSQALSTGYGLRAGEAHKLLSSLEDGGTTNTGILKSLVSGTAGMVPFIGDKLDSAAGAAMNTLPGVMGGPNSQQQQTEQARRNFINAVLRRESGAVISSSEFDNANKQYFPQPGDSPDTIAQKRKNREDTIKALAIGAGPGARNIDMGRPKPIGGVDPKALSDAELKQELGL